VTAMFLAIVLAVPLGVLAATHTGAGRSTSWRWAWPWWQSVPNFWLAIMMILLFAFLGDLAYVRARRRAARPRTMARNIAVTVSCRVAGSRAAISGSDCWPCRSEIPKSAVHRSLQEAPVLYGQGIGEAPLDTELLDLPAVRPAAA